MFRVACELHRQCLCSVGSLGKSQKASVHGYSSLLSPKYLLTAAHVAREILVNYQHFVAFRQDAYFRYEVVFADDKADVAILRATENVFLRTGSPCSRFPAMSKEPISIGMTLGYLTRMWKEFDGPEMKPVMYFSSGHVSFLGEKMPEHPRWVLSEGFIESGFSGCPVFCPDGTLIGIINGACRLVQNIDDLPGIPRCFPQLSGLESIPLTVLQQVERDKRDG